MVVSTSIRGGKPRLDLLEQPAVPIRILERGERVVGTTLRVAPADAWVLHGVVEGGAGVIEDLAHVNPAGGKEHTDRSFSKKLVSAGAANG